jgi:hypothetical protein
MLHQTAVACVIVCRSLSRQQLHMYTTLGAATCMLLPIITDIDPILRPVSDPSIPTVSPRERERTWWAHAGGGNATCLQNGLTPNLRVCCAAAVQVRRGAAVVEHPVDPEQHGRPTARAAAVACVHCVPEDVRRLALAEREHVDHVAELGGLAGRPASLQGWVRGYESGLAAARHWPHVLRTQTHPRAV